DRSIGIARIETLWLTVGANPHFVWFFLMPFQRPLGPVHFNPNVVFTAVSDLRSCHRSQRAVLESNQGGAIVVECPAGFEGLEHAGDFVGQESGYEARQIVCVRADVAPTASRSGAFRIRSPSCLLLILRFQACTQPTLQVVGADGVDFS